MPATGTYRVRWLTDYEHPITAPIPGIQAGSGQSPLRAWAQIDYQGPKERIQLVALNTIEGKQSEPIVFYDEKYGAADLEISGDTSTYFRGEAFRRPRQTVVVDVFSVKDCDDTAIASVFTFDSVDRAFHYAVQGQFYMAAFDPKHRSRKFSTGEGPPESANRIYPGPTEIQDTDSTTSLFYKKEKAITEIQLRFR